VERVVVIQHASSAASWVSGDTGFVPWGAVEVSGLREFRRLGREGKDGDLEWFSAAFGTDPGGAFALRM
jgi:hypothetical protein